jgi:hypothetical protein
MSLLSMRHRLNACVGLLTLVCSSCASVHVQKLDPNTGLPVTNAPEGVRYYMTRPYVSVYEPFIISSKVYLAAGQLSPDGNYVLLTDIPADLASIVNPALAAGKQTSTGQLMIDSGKVLAKSGIQGTPNSAPATGGTDTSKTGPTPNAPTGAGTTKPDTTSGTTKSNATQGGVTNYKVTNDNQAYALITQPRYFNIIWLPDYDEQYVVSAKAGFGTAGATINLGQGWSLQGLDASSNNSGIVGPLLDLYSGTISALQKVISTKIEGPAAALTGKPNAAPAKTDTAKTVFTGGTPVTVKITRVRIVSPGLYRILKPKEMEAAKAITLNADEASRMLVPKDPFTNIAFNTYDAVVLEASRTTGDSALRIQQYVDSTPPSTATTSGATGQQSGNPPLGAPKSALNSVLSAPENRTATGEYYVADLSYDSAAKVVVVLTKSTGDPGTAAALPSGDALTTVVIDTLKKSNVSVDKNNISITGPKK